MRTAMVFVTIFRAGAASRKKLLFSPEQSQEQGLCVHVRVIAFRSRAGAILAPEQ